MQGDTAASWTCQRIIVAHDLIQSLSEKLGVQLTLLGDLTGAQLAGCQYRHPLFDRTSPVVIGGDYITTESGTGLVHTAPGHGQEDYQVRLFRSLYSVGKPVCTKRGGRACLKGLHYSAWCSRVTSIHYHFSHNCQYVFARLSTFPAASLPSYNTIICYSAAVVRSGSFAEIVLVSRVAAVIWLSSLTRAGGVEVWAAPSVSCG